jgi:uncharacterized protein YceK
MTLALVACLTLTGCGAPQTLTTGTQTRTYPTYGLFNASTSQSNQVCYDISVGNVIWSVILIETIVVPIYMIGFSLYNPVRARGAAGCGIDA